MRSTIAASKVPIVVGDRRTSNSGNSFNHGKNGAVGQGHLDAAEANLKVAIQLAPDQAGLYANLFETYLKMAKFDEAEGAYKKALELDPNNVAASPDDDRTVALDDDFAQILGFDHAPLDDLVDQSLRRIAVQLTALCTKLRHPSLPERAFAQRDRMTDRSRFVALAPILDSRPPFVGDSD